MKKIINKNEKGITLIALVITIIVLLILAGVAISMLSGENGILTQAGKAKTEHENAQAEEEKALTDMEVELDFTETPYKFHNGYMTGIEVNGSTTEMVSEAEAKLPAGYEIYIDEETKAEDNVNVTTGMIVKKDGKTIGTIIVYGDVKMDGKIRGDDMSVAINILNMVVKDYKECQLIAMNVIQDKEINRDDADSIKDKLLNGPNINQSVEVKYGIEDIIVKNKEWCINNYMNERPENFSEKYNVNYNEETSIYEIQIESGTITAEEFLEDLQDENAKLKIWNEATSEWVEKSDDTPIAGKAMISSLIGTTGNYDIILITTT